MPLIIPGNSQASTGYTIDQSIRFNDNDSAFMKKDYSGDGSQTTFTLSGWFKLGVLSSTHCLFATGYLNGTTADFALYMNGDQIYFYGSYNGTNSQANRLETTQFFRDHSAWYHIVFVADTTNALSGERLRLYVNGSRVTAFDTETYPSQNDTLRWGDATYTHAIGASGDDTTSLNSQTPRFHYDGYMAEIHYLDGYAYDPSYFGLFNDSGIWIPKEYTGSYGTNGFKIDGRDASDLGDDESGNGNDFSTSGLASHDFCLDSPTNNFCVLNPISKPSYGSYMNRNVTGVNLQVTENGDGAVQSYGYGTFVISSGKWYYEFYTNTYPAANAIGFGWIELENAMTATDSGSSWKTPGMNQRHTSSSYSSWMWGLNNQTATGLSEFGQGVVIGVTTDFDNNTFTLTKNGSAYGSVDFDSVSPTYTLSGVEHLPLLFFGADGASLATLNFGQDSTFNGALSAGGNADGNGHGNFKYAVPSGALAICSRNVGS
mgnify:CR=1 FL=1|tara:strand:+ start:2709 stop:4172 length:1464 start_codon:yes stop_codon:yes gene_type:complete